MTATITIRPLQRAELTTLWQLGFSDPNAEWMRWNGPYFHDQLPTQTDFETIIGPRDWLIQPRNWVITRDGVIVGSVNWHFVDGSLKRWLEVGIIIYNQEHWGEHIGRTALTKWLTHLFQEETTLPHIGLTTWSGNTRMMRLAEAVGLKQEARIPQVRYWQGQYYDSVKYGIIRNDWQVQKD